MGDAPTIERTWHRAARLVQARALREAAAVLVIWGVLLVPAAESAGSHVWDTPVTEAPQR
jgi:fumarate reductase subunit C